MSAAPAVAGLAPLDPMRFVARAQISPLPVRRGRPPVSIVRYRDETGALVGRALCSDDEIERHAHDLLAYVAARRTGDTGHLLKTSEIMPGAHSGPATIFAGATGAL